MPRFRTSDGVTLHYRDEGRGLPVLCLAGLTRNGDDFVHVAPHLAEHRLIRLDYRGRGQSEWAPNESYTLQREGQDALELLDHLSIDRTVILGTSRGGLIALALALTDRDRLAGVILNDVGPDIDPAGIAAINESLGVTPEIPNLDAGARALAAMSMRSFRDVPDGHWALEAAARWRETSGGVALRYDARLRDAFLRDGPLCGLDLWPGLAALDGIPTGVIRGDGSDILSAGTLRDMKRRLPALHVAEVPGRGHVPFLDEPEALALIRTVLSEVSP